MLLSTPPILDQFRARPVVLDHEAGKGADLAAPALDRVDNPQVGIPAIADDRAAGVAAQAALEEADVRVVPQVPAEAGAGPGPADWLRWPPARNRYQ